MYLFSFIASLHFFSAVLIPFFTDWGKISFFQIMVLQSFFTASLFFLETPTGAVADKYGRKTSVALGTLISALGFLTYASTPSFTIFLLGEFILALGCALISGADESLFYDSLKEAKKEKESKKYLGRLDSITLLGILVSAPIGSIIAANFGLRATTALMAVPLLLAFCIVLTIKEPNIGRNKTREESYTTVFKKGISFFANHKILKVMALDATIVSALIFFLIWVYQVKLQSLGVPIVYFGFIHALIVIVQIGVLNSFSFFEKMTGSKRAFLVISAIIPGIFLIILGVTTSILLSIICIAIIAAFGLTRKTLYFNYIHKFIPSTRRATVLSSISMLSSFSMAVNNIVMGFLVKWDLTYALIILGAVIIVLGLLSRIEEKHLKD